MREATINRKTKETDIILTLNADAGGINKISTGIGFFDHMLNSLATHAGFNLSLTCDGDINVDCHHTVEDVGIVMGLALAEITKSKIGLARFGSAYIPMDDALAFAAVDICSRPFLVFDAAFNNEKIGELDTCVCEEFFRAFALNAGITLHIRVLYGANDHHRMEAAFKAVAHALRQALAVNSRDIFSTKGVL